VIPKPSTSIISRFHIRYTERLNSARTMSRWSGMNVAFPSQFPGLVGFCNYHQIILSRPYQTNNPCDNSSIRHTPRQRRLLQRNILNRQNIIHSRKQRSRKNQRKTLNPSPPLHHKNLHTSTKIPKVAVLTLLIRFMALR